jgi:hypothetical protein
MAAPHARTTPADIAPNDGVELDPLRNPERRRRAAAASARDIACGAETESTVLIQAAEVIAPYIDAARQEWTGPFPHVRSDEWVDAPRTVQIATLLTLGVAWIVADPHRVVAGAFKQAALDVHGAVPKGYWAQQAARPTHEELQRRRYPPDGDPATWVRGGSAA